MKHMRSIFLLFIFVAALLAACADGSGQINETPGIGSGTFGTDDGLGGTDDDLTSGTDSTTMGTDTGTNGTDTGTTGTDTAATDTYTDTTEVSTTEAVDVTGTETSGQATQVGSGTPGAGAPQGVEDDDTDPSRISNLLDFRVVLQDGEDVGEVDDLVLDFSQQHVVYLVVGTGGLLGIGEKNLLIPWESIQLPMGRGSDTNDTEDDKVISLVAGISQESIDNAPDFDFENDFPEVGTVDEMWDVDLNTYWTDFTSAVGGVATQVTGTKTSETPAADSTMKAQTTSTVTAETGTGMTQGLDTMGVVLATDVLGYDFRIGTGGLTNDVMDTTGTPGASGTQVGTDTGTDLEVDDETTNATIDDVVIGVETGEILYIVIRTDLGEGDDRLMPVHVDAVNWDGENEAFVLDLSATELQDAPLFEDGAYPDTTMNGWDDEFSAFWANFTSGLP